MSSSYGYGSNGHNKVKASPELLGLVKHILTPVRDCAWPQQPIGSSWLLLLVKFLLCLVIDFIGNMSYMIPGLGEATDVAWAPIATWLAYFLFHGNPSLGGLMFFEEIMPGLDIVPTATIGFLLEHRDNMFIQMTPLGPLLGLVATLMRVQTTEGLRRAGRGA